MKKIKLMALDIDGCITPGEGFAADLGVLAKLVEFNRAAAAGDPDIPAITLCTGRQQPFVDLMCQVIGAKIPAIFENGAGLHVPSPYGFHFHPSITPEMIERMGRAKKAIADTMVPAGECFIQPGKEVSLTVYALEGHTIAGNAARLREIFDERSIDLFLDVSVSCVNILLPGLDKGAGVRWLAEREGLSLEEIAGVGDSPGDLAYLEICGFSATPANGDPSVQKAVNYVSKLENGLGTIDIIEECIKKNRNAC